MRTKRNEITKRMKSTYSSCSCFLSEQKEWKKEEWNKKKNEITLLFSYSLSEWNETTSLNLDPDLDNGICKHASAEQTTNCCYDDAWSLCKTVASPATASKQAGRQAGKRARTCTTRTRTSQRHAHAQPNQTPTHATARYICSRELLLYVSPACLFRCTLPL